MNWTRPAVCFSVDDVHPAPVARQALDCVKWLQERHPQLRVTLFTTPDWQTLDPYPSRRLLSRIPLVRDRVFTVRVHPRGTYRLDRHAGFCAMLRDWAGAEVALHGLHHVTRGMQPVLEFANRSAGTCRAMLDEAVAMFEDANVTLVRGMAAPGWHAPQPLLEAMCDAGFRFVGSARDLDSPVSRGGRANGSGMRGVALFAPQRLESGLIHFPVNFQATSPVERALAIVECGGMLSIKAHLLAESGSYRALDGLTPQYVEYLHRVLSAVEDRFGDRVWWTSMGELAQ